MSLRNKFIAPILFVFILFVFNFVGVTFASEENNSGKLSDTAIINENEPGLIIDTGGPSFIRGDKFVNEVDPNFLPPKGEDRREMQKKKDLVLFGVILILIFLTSYLIFQKHKQGKIAHGCQFSC